MILLNARLLHLLLLAPMSPAQSGIAWALAIHAGGLTHPQLGDLTRVHPASIRRTTAEMRALGYISATTKVRTCNKEARVLFVLTDPETWPVPLPDRVRAARIADDLTDQRNREHSELWHEEAEEIARLLHLAAGRPFEAHPSEPVWVRWCGLMEGYFTRGIHPATMRAVMVHAITTPPWSERFVDSREADQHFAAAFGSILEDWRGRRRPRWSFLS